jgi:chemotaxis signal transduction protein
MSIENLFPNREDDPAYQESIWKRRAERLQQETLRWRTPSEVKTDTRARWLLAVVGERKYALPLEQIAAVIQTRPEERGTPVPGAPPSFWGLLAVRGEVYSVFDMRVLLREEQSSVPKEEGEAASGSPILLLKAPEASEDERLGLYIDRAESILTQGTPAAVEAPALETPFLRGMISLTDNEDGFALVVDISALRVFLTRDTAEYHAGKDEA